MRPAANEPAGAGPEARALSVTEFTGRVKALLKGGMPPCWVRGEVSNVRVQPSGHAYFSLKDAGAQLPAVLFRAQAARQSVALKDGIQVIAYGHVDVYEPQGKYQLVVEELVAAGVGELQRRYEALKRRLADEGLFDPARKKPIPLLPATVGFVTSPAGAAVRDFLRILARRGWRGRVVVLPSRVQGEGAAQEMADMLSLAESLGIFELLVIGRGGGSIEDLWAFNEEVLVRAVAACAVPTISAVGHEIDFTLCDFAADRRAETPSAAAELISSAFGQPLDRTESAGEAARAAAGRAIERAGERLAHARSRLRLLSPSSLVERGHLRLDDVSNRLDAAARAALRGGAERLGGAAGRFERASPETRLLLLGQRVQGLAKRVAAASPASVLHRGFAIVRDQKGAPVTRRASIRPGQRLEAEFSDGRTPLRAEGG